MRLNDYGYSIYYNGVSFPYLKKIGFCRAVSMPVIMQNTTMISIDLNYHNKTHLFGFQLTSYRHLGPILIYRNFNHTISNVADIRKDILEFYQFLVAKNVVSSK